MFLKQKTHTYIEITRRSTAYRYLPCFRYPTGDHKEMHKPTYAQRLYSTTPWLPYTYVHTYRMIVIKTYNHSSARWRRRRFRLGRLTEVTDFLLHNGTYGYIQERCQVPGTGNAS